jgi:hypothetical protein
VSKPKVNKHNKNISFLGKDSSKNVYLYEGNSTAFVNRSWDARSQKSSGSINRQARDPSNYAMANYPDQDIIEFVYDPTKSVHRKPRMKKNPNIQKRLSIKRSNDSIDRSQHVDLTRTLAAPDINIYPGKTSNSQHHKNQKATLTDLESSTGDQGHTKKIIARVGDLGFDGLRLDFNGRTKGPELTTKSLKKKAKGTKAARGMSYDRDLGDINELTEVVIL